MTGPGDGGAGGGAGDGAGGEWYRKGLRFECTRCGACCTGPPGHVGFSEAEGRAIAERLGLGYDEFLSGYTRETADGRSLGEVRTAHGFDCVFLDRSSVPGKAVCGIYESRPTQCRTFPWWPENLATKRRWEALSRSCEGVGRGGFVPIDRIRIQRDEQAGAEDRLRRERGE